MRTVHSSSTSDSLISRSEFIADLIPQLCLLAAQIPEFELIRQMQESTETFRRTGDAQVVYDFYNEHKDELLDILTRNELVVEKKNLDGTTLLLFLQVKVLYDLRDEAIFNEEIAQQALDKAKRAANLPGKPPLVDPSPLIRRIANDATNQINLEECKADAETAKAILTANFCGDLEHQLQVFTNTELWQLNFEREMKSKAVDQINERLAVVESQLDARVKNTKQEQIDAAIPLMDLRQVPNTPAFEQVGPPYQIRRWLEGIADIRRRTTNE